MLINTFAYDSVQAYLAEILASLTGKSAYTVTNSAHFASTINEETVDENEIMVSFRDVEFVFTNVPIKGVVLKSYVTETSEWPKRL